MKKNKSIEKGFTLIELMVSVSIVAILLVLAVPSLKDFIEKNKIKTAAISMNSGIQLARSEAIKRNSIVTFNLTNSQWSVMSNNELISLSQYDMSSTITQTIQPTGASSLTFNNMGMLTIDADGLSNINKIILGSSKSNYKLWVMLSNSGGSRICDPAENTLSTSVIGCI